MTQQSPPALTDKVLLFADHYRQDSTTTPDRVFCTTVLSLQEWNGTDWTTIDIFGENVDVDGGFFDLTRAYRYSPIQESIRIVGTGISTSDSVGITRQLASTKPSATFSTFDMDGVPTGTAGETGDWVYFDNGKIGAIGDPHIIPLNGKTYDFDKSGIFKFFDNNSKSYRTYINCSIDYISYKRWRNKKYFRHIYINCGDAQLLIYLGFRGSRVEILYNDSFEIYETSQNINKNALNHCLRCGFSSSSNIDIKKHSIIKRHRFVRILSNRMIIKFSDETQNYELKVNNVNKYNYEPCDIEFKLENLNYSIIKEYSGLIIDEKYCDNSVIDNLIF
ncbi:MAG: hypothetical protein CMF62_00730 [Magnetococcales bacterium]|nr:hypothetical protein [Magnetococcales bacterium]